MGSAIPLFKIVVLRHESWGRETSGHRHFRLHSSERIMTFRNSRQPRMLGRRPLLVAFPILQFSVDVRSRFENYIGLHKWVRFCTEYRGTNSMMAGIRVKGRPMHCQARWERGPKVQIPGEAGLPGPTRWVSSTLDIDVQRVSHQTENQYAVKQISAPFLLILHEFREFPHRILPVRVVDRSFGCPIGHVDIGDNGWAWD